MYDIGSQNGTAFIVMEYLEGQTLADRLQKGALAIPDIVRIGSQIADALDRAHRAGVIHRDLKPGNIMLTKSGAKLLDFGLAKLVGTGTSAGTSAAPLLSAAVTLSSPSPQLSPLTTQGAIIGTIQYMSPEQIQGLEADARSDIFAFGTVLYEMATGKRPFDGKSQIKTASAILEDEPLGITSIVASAPKPLEQLTSRMLAKDPEQRWQSAADVKSALAMIAEAMPVAATSATPSARRKHVAAWSALSLSDFLAVHSWHSSYL